MNIISVVTKQTIIFATLGLIAQLLILWLMGLFEFWKYLDQLLAGITGTYLVAGGLGLVAGQLIYRNGTGGPLLWFTGIGVAWTCLLVCTLAGSSVEFLRNRFAHDAFGDYIVKPTFWFLVLGTIPAILFGIAYAARIKYLINRQ